MGMRGRAAALGLALAALLSGCGMREYSDPGVAVSTADARGCPRQDLPAGQGISIDWVPLVVVDGVQYQEAMPRATVPATATGRSMGEVRCRIADQVVDPEYQLQDGDATYLAVGTRLRETRGYDTSLRIAVDADEGWVIYEAVDVPGATTAGDLLDVDGRVTRIDRLGGPDGDQVVASVTAPADIERLVAALLAAPLLDRLPAIDENPSFLRLTLDDGTTVSRAWWPDAGLLQPRIVVPTELAAALPDR